MFVIASVHSDEYTRLANKTFVGNKIPYCEKHRYIARLRNISNDVSVGWAKIDLVKETLSWVDENAWIWVLGVDTLITNFAIKLETIVNRYPTSSFIITTDRNGYNADSFLIKNDEFGNWFIDNLLSLRHTQELLSKGWDTEQGAIHYYMENRLEEDIKNDKCVFIPQRIMNSYDYNLYPSPEINIDYIGTCGQWQSHDFLIHWPGTSLEQRLKLADEYLQLVVNDR